MASPPGGSDGIRFFGQICAAMVLLGLFIKIEDVRGQTATKPMAGGQRDAGATNGSAVDPEPLASGDPRVSVVRENQRR